MSRLLFSSLILAAGVCLASPAIACEGILPEATLRQLLPEASSLSQLSDVPERCLYQWAKPDQATRREANDVKLRESMRRGSESYSPQSLWNSLTIEIFAVATNEQEARNLFNQYLSGRSPQNYGSPDPLANTTLERLNSGEKRQQAWNSQTRQLLLQAGNRLFLLTVDIEDDAKKNQALAIQIADKLK